MSAVPPVERLLAEAEDLPDPRARGLAKALAAALVDLVGAGLERVIELGGADLARTLADDELVGNLMVLCGMHPDPATVRAERALAAARTELGSLGVAVDASEPTPEGVRVRAVRGARRGDGFREGPRTRRDDRARSRAGSRDGRGDPLGKRGQASRVRAARAAACAPVTRLYRATRRTPDAERCELCAAPLAGDHEHLYEPRARQVRCACQACAVIVPTAERSPYRRVPRRFERLPIDAGPWFARFGVPVGIAALFVRDDGHAIVGFPGPAGLVETEVDDDAWNDVRAELGLTLTPEVEAIVWSSLPGGGCWIAGIDVVFRMIAELRKSWVGFAGGPDVPAAIARVLAEHRA